MNNMYDILATMNLLESKGSKPDFLDLDKDGNRKEAMKSAAADSNKPKKAFSKMGEADVGEGNRFTGNLMKARAAGKKQADLDGDGNMEVVREYDFDDRDDFDNRAKPGDTLKTTKGTLKKTTRGVQHTRRADDEDTGSDDDYDEYGNRKAGAKKSSDGPKKKGRPAGSKRAIGAKGPSGKSKLLQKGSIKETDISLVDQGEYDREGDMAREQLHTAAEAAKELHDILDADENLPEWVQSKITKALDYLDTARDYMKASDAEDSEEMPMTEKAVSRQQQKFMGMAHAMQKGERIKGASSELKKVAKTMSKGDVEDFAKTKHKGLPEKKKKDVDETTVAGSVATAPAGGKAAKGMMFGKGVYEGQIAESFERKLNMITEGMSINMSMGEDGTKSLTVSATDDDAMQLAQLLKMAGIGSSSGYQETCSSCGSANCGCEQMDEAQDDLANAPDEETETTDYMTKTIAGGLNKPKRDVAGNGQTTVPVSAVRVQEEADIESHLTNLYKQFKA
jgi:phage anti-repressor protein